MACYDKTKLKQYKLTAKAKRYGLTTEQWLQRLASQNNKCAICENEFANTKAIHTDHGHATGQVRGFLCKTCNLGLGYFKDNKTLLQRALEYLDAT